MVRVCQTNLGALLRILRGGDGAEAARKTKPEGELVAYWEAINDKLRNLGIRLVPLENSTKE